MQIVKPKEPDMLSAETDEDLLVIMSIKDDTPASHAAFNTFHARYKLFLFELLERVCSSHPNRKELVNTLFSNVLISIYKYCHTFNAEDETDPDQVRKKISGWLATIARHEYKSQFINAVEPKKEQLAYQRMIRSGTEKPKYDFDAAMVAKAFEQIPKQRDRDILRTYWVYYEKGEKSQAKNMPDDVLKGMAEQYNTNKANIRQIISRTNKIVQEYLQANYKI